MVVLITGSNKGIGLSIAELFAKSGTYDSDIIITSRNVENGTKTLNKLQDAYPNSKFALHQLDITDPKSRSDLIAWVRKKYGTIDVLINNAGFAYKQADDHIPIHKQAVDTLGINYYATKDFTNEIVDGGLISERIVTVSSLVSGMAYNGSSDEIKAFCTNQNFTQQSEDDVNRIADDFVESTKNETHAPKYTKSSYMMSKLLIRKITEIQAYKWPKLKVFCGDPGWCKSDMAGWDKPPKTAEQGADNFWWMATSNDEQLLQSSGKFYMLFRQRAGWDDDYDFSRFSTFQIPEGKEIGKL